MTRSLGCSNVGPSHGRASFTGNNTAVRLGERSRAMAQAVLTGFQADAVNPALRYNDSVTIVPHDVNGLAAFAGAADARPWFQVLEPEVATPPNLRDCQWRLVPRRTYTEARALHKISKEGRWDQGRNLDWPEVPKDGDDLEQLAHSFMVRHGLAMYERDAKGRDLKDKTGARVLTAGSVRQLSLIKQVLEQRMAAQAEHDGNLSEEQRRHGHMIRYGDSVQLLHVSTESFLSISKTQALEKGSKSLRLVHQDQGADNCIFKVQPAFKTYMIGEAVSSGDLVVLQTSKPIGGVHHCIHMSDLATADLTKAKRALQIKNEAIVEVKEMNAATQRSFFRMLRYQSFAELFNPDQMLRAEDVVAFYHKEAEAYLHLDMRDCRKGLAPCFRYSARTSAKVRKKSSWMFKIESLQPLEAGARVRADDEQRYRIKHVISNVYLKRDGDKLGVTLDYKDDACLFMLKQFDRHSERAELSQNSLAFVRSADGAWLAQVRCQEDRT